MQSSIFTRLVSLVRYICCVGLILGAVVRPSSHLVFASEDQQRLAKSLSHYTMGLVADLLGETEEGIKEYKQALHDADNYTSHLHLGIDYARLGNLQPAMDELLLAAKINPDDLKSHYLLALVYSTKNEFDKAANEYELILKHFSAIEPENIEIYSYLGQLYYSRGKFTKAIEQFEKILFLEPKNAEMIYVLGSLYLEIGNRQKAIELFKQSLSIDEKNEGSLNSLGYVYAEDGVNLDEAVSLVKRALEISPDNGAYWDSLGWIYYRKGMYVEALEFLQKANSLLEDAVIYDHLGDVYLKLNEVEKAKKYWGLALKLSPEQTSIIKKLQEFEHHPTHTQTLSSAPARNFPENSNGDISNENRKKYSTQENSRDTSQKSR